MDINYSDIMNALNRINLKNNPTQLSNNYTDIDNINVLNMSIGELKILLKSLSNEDKVKLMDKIINAYKDDIFYNLSSLILCLPPKVRIKYIDNYDFYSKDSISEFIKEMTNEEDLFIVAKSVLNNTDKSSRIEYLFTIVPYNKKIEFLDLIAEKEEEIKKNLIDKYNIEHYLNCFKIEDRLYVLKNVIFEKFQKDHEDIRDYYYEQKVRFDPGSYRNILSLFLDGKCDELFHSKIYEAFQYLIGESKKNLDKETKKSVRIYDINKIVNIFYENGYDIYQVIDYIIKSDVIDEKFGLCDLVEELPDDVRKNVIEFFINSNYENRKISYLEFFAILDKLSFNYTKELYLKYCIKNKKIDYLYPIKNISNLKEEGYYPFDYLKIIFENLDKEELDLEYEKIKIKFSEITKFQEYDEKYDLIIKVFADKNNLDVDKVKRFVKKFGYNILKYLENENIKKIINLDDKQIEKLFNLYSEDTIKFNKSTVNDIINTLLQRLFMLEEKESYNIFSTFEELVNNNDKEQIKILLLKILGEFDYRAVLEKNNCSIEELYNQIIVGNLDLLHVITDNYIGYKRDKFIKEQLPNTSKTLSLKRVISRESYKEDFIKNNYYMIVKECKKLKNVKYSNDQKFILENEDIFDELIMFKQNPKDYTLKVEYRRYLKALNELLDIMYDNKIDLWFYREDSPHCVGYKFDYIQEDISNEYLIGILLESNYDGLVNLLSNDENYESLKRYFEKYKLMGWQDSFTNLLNKCDLQFYESTIASLISNYDKIKPYINSKNLLTSIIDYANCYCTSSNYYKLLFGMEDYNLIAANAGKNKASMSRKDRLEGCKNLIPMMYNKRSFSVPTVDEKFKLNNGKDIRIIVGNATNMINLTYGERTEACMRKGGAFNSLFEHCAVDKNGFHIRFVDPNSGEFISRVSGTRNGNTIFLNELRSSLSLNYSNEDLYEAIKLLSKKIISLSKDSEFPIDNVVVTSDYALENYKDECVDINLSIDERKEVLRGVAFNFNDKCLLLANSDNTSEVKPYILSDNLPSYDSIRDEVKVYYGKQAIDRILQLKLINGVINKEELENINVEYNDELPEYVISGEDYYIAYNKDKVNVFVLDSCKDNLRTIVEINDILNNNNVNVNFNEANLGGVRK